MIQFLSMTHVEFKLIDGKLMRLNSEVIFQDTFSRDIHNSFF